MQEKQNGIQASISTMEHCWHPRDYQADALTLQIVSHKKVNMCDWWMFWNVVGPQKKGEICFCIGKPQSWFCFFCDKVVYSVKLMLLVKIMSQEFLFLDLPTGQLTAIFAETHPFQHTNLTESIHIFLSFYLKDSCAIIFLTCCSGAAQQEEKAHNCRTWLFACK